MQTHVDLDPADLMALAISFIGEPLSPDRAYVRIGKDRGAASRPSADDCRRIAASWQALGDEIARRIFERDHAPVLDRAFGTAVHAATEALDAELRCDGRHCFEYLVNGDAPEEGTDIHHDEVCSLRNRLASAS